jgi:glutamine synthetase
MANMVSCNFLSSPNSLTFGRLTPCNIEINWEYDEALLTADRHVFMKYMVKEIAQKHGMRATFMPKPSLALTGSG